MGKEPKVAETLQVSFGKARIRSDGEIGMMTLRQYDQEIVLTPEQARSLANQIRDRFGADGQ